MASYTKFRNGFEITSAAAIDKRILLTKDQMLHAEETYILPDKYFCICANSAPDPDSGKIFLFDNQGTWSTETGHYHVLETGGTYVAGNGIIISGNTISVDTGVVATVTALNNEITRAQLAEATLTIEVNKKSEVSASAAGTSTSEIHYITINGTEYKLPEAGESKTYYAGDGLSLSADNTFSVKEEIARKVYVLEEVAKKSKVEASTINGNILIDGVETKVYGLPSDVVRDVNYKHITVTGSSVSDGTNTFSQYDDTALKGRVAAVESGLSAETASRVAADTNLSQRIDALEGRGRFLSGWKSDTGLPDSYPSIPAGTDYNYKAGDYYIVVSVSANNKKPSGDHITHNADGSWTIPSENETNIVVVGDSYYYTSTGWSLVHTPEKTVLWGDISGELSKQTDLQAALDAKASVNYVDTKVAAETSRAEGIESQLSAAISLKADKTYVDEKLGLKADASALVAEQNRAIAAEGTLRAAISEKQDILVAGSNITIAADGKTISAKDTTYTAGENITISASNVISATVSGGVSKQYVDDKVAAEASLRAAEDLKKLDRVGATLVGSEKFELDSGSAHVFVSSADEGYPNIGLYCEGSDSQGVVNVEDAGAYLTAEASGDDGAIVGAMNDAGADGLAAVLAVNLNSENLYSGVGASAEGVTIEVSKEVEESVFERTTIKVVQDSITLDTGADTWAGPGTGAGIAVDKEYGVNLVAKSQPEDKQSISVANIAATGSEVDITAYYNSTAGSAANALVITPDNATISVMGSGSDSITTKEYVDTQVATKSTVSVSGTGTSTEEAKYITIDGNEYKLAGTGSQPEPHYPVTYQTTINYGEDKIAAIDAVTSGKVLYNGDIAIVKEIFAGTAGEATSKYEHTAFIYDNTIQEAGTYWKAMDGNYNAENVYFNEDLIYTAAIGVLPKPASSASLSAKGKNVKQVLSSILAQENDPNVTYPSLTISSSNIGAKEVGTTIGVAYGTSFNAGSYTYGPATGITASNYQIKFNGQTMTGTSGTFDNVVVNDSTSLKITGTFDHTQGAMPKTNLGNDCPGKRITAQSAKAAGEKGTLSGFRKMFYGTFTSKDELTSDLIRSLTGVEQKAYSGNSLSVSIPVGAIRVVIAVPNDTGTITGKSWARDVTSVKDVNDSSAEIMSAFVSEFVNVDGVSNFQPIRYKVYICDYSKPADKANTYKVTII